MADRPILFSAPMVRALLEGRKTQTRRVLKPQPPAGHDLIGIYAPWLTAVFNPVGKEGDGGNPDHDVMVPFPFLPKDRLWVREAWRTWKQYDYCPPSGLVAGTHVAYEATPEAPNLADNAGRLRTSMFMPRWASRLTLTVTDVRVQRLQEISEEDAVQEGFPVDGEGRAWGVFARDLFEDLWDSISAKRPGCLWADNPWIVALTFVVDRRNIDEVQ